MRSPDRVRISLIVPALDEADGVAAALAPLQPLRARGDEVIVVDGGSRDATVAMAAPLADRVLVASRGRAAQMNAGAAVARGDVLLFVHADTLVGLDAVEAMRRALPHEHRRWGRFDVTIVGTSPWLAVIAALMNVRSRWTAVATGDQAIFVERALFHAVGGFPDQPLMEDVALSRTLRERGPPLCCRERVRTSGRRWERHGVCRTIVHMWRLRWAYWRGADPRALAARYPVHDPGASP